MRVILSIVFSIIHISFAQEKSVINEVEGKRFYTVINNSDTVQSVIPDTTIKFRKVNFSAVVGEILLGGVSGIIGCIPSLVVMSKMKNFEGIALLPLVYISYNFASSTAVYLLAEHYNYNTSFWGTVGAGFAGDAFGVVTVCLFMNNLSDGGFLFPLLGIPLLSEVLYVNLVTPKQNYSSPNSASLIKDKKHYTNYQDIYNSTLIFNSEIFRLSF